MLRGGGGEEDRRKRHRPPAQEEYWADEYNARGFSTTTQNPHPPLGPRIPRKNQQGSSSSNNNNSWRTTSKNKTPPAAATATASYGPGQNNSSLNGNRKASSSWTRTSSSSNNNQAPPAAYGPVGDGTTGWTKSSTTTSSNGNSKWSDQQQNASLATAAAYNHAPRKEGGDWSRVNVVADAADPMNIDGGKPAASGACYWIKASSWDDMTFQEQYETLLKASNPQTSWPVIKWPNDSIKKFKEMQQQAVELTKEQLRNERKANQANEKKAKRRYYHDSNEDGSDDEPMGRIVSINGRKVNHDAEYEALWPLIEALPHCAPLVIGFQAQFVYPHAAKWIYCPCGRQMEEWRRRFRLNHLFHDDHMCGRHGASHEFDAHPFTKHLQDIGNSEFRRGFVPIHRIILYYLHHLYGDYWGPGDKHKHLCDVGTAAYKRAAAKEADEIHGYVLQQPD